MEASAEQLAADLLDDRSVPGLLEAAHRCNGRPAVATRHRAAPEDVEAAPGLGARGKRLVAKRWRGLVIARPPVIARTPGGGRVRSNLGFRDGFVASSHVAPRHDGVTCSLGVP